MLTNIRGYYACALDEAFEAVRDCTAGECSRADKEVDMLQEYIDNLGIDIQFRVTDYDGDTFFINANKK